MLRCSQEQKQMVLFESHLAGTHIRRLIVNPRGQLRAELCRHSLGYFPFIMQGRKTIIDGSRNPDMGHSTIDGALLKSICAMVRHGLIRPPIDIPPGTKLRFERELTHSGLVILNEEAGVRQPWMQAFVFDRVQHRVPRWLGFTIGTDGRMASSFPAVYTTPFEAIVHTAIRQMIATGDWQ